MEAWPQGIAPAEADGNSAPLDLQLAIAPEQAAELKQALGLAELGARRRVGAVLEQPDLALATIYFRYQLHRALAEAGLGDR